MLERIKRTRVPLSFRSRISFDKDWNFYLGNETQAFREDFDDSAWRKLNVPHDWSIEGNLMNMRIPEGQELIFLLGLDGIENPLNWINQN